MENTLLEDLKIIEYGEAWDFQEYLLKKGVDEKIKCSSEPDYQAQTENYLFFCTHPHVYTLGKHGNQENLLWSQEELEREQVSFYKTNRGGDITYHGPGQLVAYPILDLEKFSKDLRQYMRSLEEVVIKLLAEYGIKGERLEKSTGVWLDPDDPFKARKICAMGVRCSRWITIHGLALNMNTDLDYFTHIVPCGISDKGVTSMQVELGREVDEDEVKRIFVEKFKEVFKTEIGQKGTSIYEQYKQMAVAPSSDFSL